MKRFFYNAIVAVLILATAAGAWQASEILVNNKVLSSNNPLPINGTVTATVDQSSVTTKLNEIKGALTGTLTSTIVADGNAVGAAHPMPASITNFPATTQLVTNSDNQLIVAISSQSNPIVASISNLPSTQDLKVDSNNNLSVNPEPPVSYLENDFTATNAAASYTTSANCEHLTIVSHAADNVNISFNGGATATFGLSLTATGTFYSMLEIPCPAGKRLHYISETGNNARFTIIERKRQ